MALPVTRTPISGYLKVSNWAGTPQQLKPITADPKNKRYKSRNLNYMQQLISWSKNLAVLHFKQILLKLLGDSGSGSLLVEPASNNRKEQI